MKMNHVREAGAVETAITNTKTGATLAAAVGSAVKENPSVVVAVTAPVVAEIVLLGGILNWLIGDE